MATCRGGHHGDRSRSDLLKILSIHDWDRWLVLMVESLVFSDITHTDPPRWIDKTHL
jgi:hypothetical protein